MAQTNLKVGAQVELKSGGPQMTVKEIKTKEFLPFGGANELETNIVYVTWFDSKGELKTADFTEPQLNILE